MDYNVAVLAGDGIGPEIAAAVQRLANTFDEWKTFLISIF